jgi:hypothetical protein
MPARKKLVKPAPRNLTLGVRLSVREIAMLQDIVNAEGVRASELVRRWLKAAHDSLGVWPDARAR